MYRIRIVLACLPRMLADIVQRILAEAPDLEVAETLSGLDQLAEVVTATDADVVVAGIAPSEGIARLDPILRSHPSLRVFVLEGDGRRAVMYELQPHSVPLGDVSPEGLIDAIRAAVPVRDG